MDGMTRVLAAGLILAAAVPAWAQRPGNAGGAQGRGQYQKDMQLDAKDRRDNQQDRKERMERIRRELELRRTFRIAEDLGIPESDALKMNERLRATDAQRRALRKQVKASVEELRQMAAGSPNAADVEKKIAEIQALRRQMLEAEERGLHEVSQGLKPSQKARLALILASQRSEFRKMKRKMRMEGPGGLKED